ncbi:MAG: response regulator [Cyanobacteria bacterium J06588_4]
MTYPKILIIDDNPSDRTLALRELRKLFPDFQAVEISDEAGFTEALQTENFNIFITSTSKHNYRTIWSFFLEAM